MRCRIPHPGGNLKKKIEVRVGGQKMGGEEVGWSSPMRVAHAKKKKGGGQTSRVVLPRASILQSHFFSRRVSCTSHTETPFVLRQRNNIRKGGGDSRSAGYEGSRLVKWNAGLKHLDTINDK